MRRRRLSATVAGATALAALAAGAAAADGPPGLTASFSPATAATGTAVTATLDGAALAAAQQGTQLAALRLTAPAGLRVDRAGVRGICTTAQAAALACPAASRVGRGDAVFGAGPVGDVSASLELFATTPAAGDILGLQLVASALGRRIPLSARITQVAGSVMLTAGDLGKAFPLPVTVKRLSLTLGARNTVKRVRTTRVRRRVTRHGRTHTTTLTQRVTVTTVRSLITTPPSCPAGGWPVAAALDFSDGGNLALSATVPCTAKAR